ncbi:MAG: hypothetical protein HYV59_03990 [Planctomycetes bacterium]|nr:hypothetical protein [Planctomycetota bacterium]
MQTNFNAKIINPRISKEIDIFLEGYYGKSKEAAKMMVDCELEKTQARGLETLTATTSRFSEIINYVKRQTGKDTKNKWIRIGPKLISQLEELEKKAEELSKDDADSCLDIKLRLARGWVNQVVCHYLYGKTIKEDGKKQNGN